MRRLLASIAIALTTGLAAGAPGARAAPAGEDALARLADRYAPIVVVRDQAGECDREGEPYRPVPVETVLGKADIALLDGDGHVILRGPTAQDLAGRGPETSLDFPGDPRRPGCTFEKDFRRLGAGEPDTAYAHLATDASAPGRVVLQYWLFWYFDDYVNTHEGDWEFVQIVFPAASAADALATTPTAVGYSQHSGGESADWGDPKLRREGDHPLVYAAAGSHANYYDAAVYLGRSADEGFGCDDTTAPSTRLPVEARVLPSTPPDPSGPLAWLLFQGRWGALQPPPYDAPPGPQTKKEWAAPVAWQDSLRDASFAIPAQSTLGPTATGAFCSVVRIGGRVYTAVTSSLVLVLIVLGLVSVGGVAARSTRWSPRVTTPLRRRRESGQIVRAALGLYRGHRRTMLALGALFVPAAIIEALVQELLLAVTPLGDLVSVAGESSLLSASVALLVGGAGHLVATATVLTGVAGALAELEAGRAGGPRAAYRELGRRLGPSLGGVALAAVAVILLSLTVVAVPLAVYLMVRWALIPQVAAIEDLPARAAVARSRALTRGRWWRTARLALLVNAIGAASGPAIGIALLFLTELPLATINGVSSLVFVVAIPFVGAAMALLYGDLAAAEAGR